MRGEILGVIFASIISLVGLLIIVINIDPSNASLVVICLFYFVIFLFIWSVAVLVGYNIRRLLAYNFIHERLFFSSFWWGLVVAGAVAGLLIINKFFV